MSRKRKRRRRVGSAPEAGGPGSCRFTSRSRSRLSNGRLRAIIPLARSGRFSIFRARSRTNSCRIADSPRPKGTQLHSWTRSRKPCSWRQGLEASGRLTGASDGAARWAAAQ